jgi:hypothetical protein
MGEHRVILFNQPGSGDSAVQAQHEMTELPPALRRFLIILQMLGLVAGAGLEPATSGL